MPGVFTNRLGNVYDGVAQSILSVTLGTALFFTAVIFYNRRFKNDLSRRISNELIWQLFEIFGTTTLLSLVIGVQQFNIESFRCEMPSQFASLWQKIPALSQVQFDSQIGAWSSRDILNSLNVTLNLEETKMWIAFTSVHDNYITFYLWVAVVIFQLILSVYVIICQKKYLSRVVRNFWICFGNSIIFVLYCISFRKRFWAADNFSVLDNMLTFNTSDVESQHYRTLYESQKTISYGNGTCFNKYAITFCIIFFLFYLIISAAFLLKYFESKLIAPLPDPHNTEVPHKEPKPSSEHHDAIDIDMPHAMSEEPKLCLCFC